jgi:hypothetical protein
MLGDPDRTEILAVTSMVIESCLKDNIDTGCMMAKDITPGTEDAGHFSDAANWTAR